MAMGFKTGGRNFQKGQSGNPNGRPPLPREIRVSLSMLKYEIGETLNRLLKMPRRELEKVKTDPDAMALEWIIASCILKNDPKTLEIFFNRCLGPPPKKEVEHPDTEKGAFFNFGDCGKSELEIFDEELQATQ